jgi:RimJ/RimL family protein N-acetyltransferase
MIRLRPTTLEDLPALFENGVDAEANALAGTKARRWPDFVEAWTTMLLDPRATARTIEREGLLVGAINVFPLDGIDTLGYWLARAWWGQGIATRAVGLMLDEIACRPLVATVAAHNLASLRVLAKHGFVERTRTWTEEDARRLARITVTLERPARP